METAAVAAVVTLTSLTAAWMASRRGIFSLARLARALTQAMELVGWGVLFFTVNLALQIVAIVAVRTFTRFFVSAYVLDDVSLVIVSALQGLIVGSYRAVARGRSR